MQTVPIMNSKKRKVTRQRSVFVEINQFLLLGICSTFNLCCDLVTPTFKYLFKCVISGDFVDNNRQQSVLLGFTCFMQLWSDLFTIEVIKFGRVLLLSFRFSFFFWLSLGLCLNINLRYVLYFYMLYFYTKPWGVWL